MACGIPVVCSDIHCVNTFARDGENIFLASNNKKWAEKISILINSEKTRLKLGAEGRKTVEKLFSINSNAPVLARTIKQFLKKQQ
jgi:glycosyltransferase involved in cell wall biosynthesis